MPKKCVDKCVIEHSAQLLPAIRISSYFCTFLFASLALALSLSLSLLSTWARITERLVLGQRITTVELQSVITISSRRRYSALGCRVALALA